MSTSYFMNIGAYVATVIFLRLRVWLWEEC